MRTATGLTVIAVGAILAFAVTTSTPLVNVHIVGWVLILTGLAGIFVPRKGYGWLRRRMVLRPGGRGKAMTPDDDGPRGSRSVVARPLPGDTPAGLAGFGGGVHRPGTDTFTSGLDAPVETETIEEFKEE